MKAHVDSIIRQHGQHLILQRKSGGGTVEIQAFVQPYLKKRLHPPVTATPLGAVNEQQWTYIGNGDIDICPGDKIQQDTMVWKVQEARKVCCGDEILYRWAMLQPAKEAVV